MTLRTYTTHFLFLCLSYLGIANEIYQPDDLYSISCGSSNNFTVDGRNWTAGINTKVLLETQNKSLSVAANALSLTNVQGPCTSARVSYSQFTYSFPVTTAGPKFLRLFFYPTLYQNFDDPSKDYFSVTSGGYTLLENFNASLYADADDSTSDTFFREYFIYVQDGDRTLNVTFIPSTPKNHTDPYHVFLNGIEVVSVPTYLYHTKPDNDYTRLQLVGYGTFYPLENNSALETKYCFNVAGRIISPSGDTSMLSYWGADDGNYATSQSVLAVKWGNTRISHSLPKSLNTRHLQMSTEP